MPCHKRLKKGQQPAGIFQVFFLRVDVHILHGFQICPAAHALQRFFRYACAIGACGEGMTEAMRRFAVDVDCCANALPQAAICLKGERLMRTLLFEWCVATFILPEFVNYVSFFCAIYCTLSSNLMRLPHYSKKRCYGFKPHKATLLFYQLFNVTNAHNYVLILLSVR